MVSDGCSTCLGWENFEPSSWSSCLLCWSHSWFVQIPQNYWPHPHFYSLIKPLVLLYTVHTLRGNIPLQLQFLGHDFPLHKSRLKNWKPWIGAAGEWWWQALTRPGKSTVCSVIIGSSSARWWAFNLSSLESFFYVISRMGFFLGGSWFWELLSGVRRKKQFGFSGCLEYRIRVPVFQKCKDTLLLVGPSIITRHLVRNLFIEK